MELYLNRLGRGKGKYDISTIGELIVGDVTVVTIEDDFDDIKEQGMTRIPFGRYEIKLRKEGRIHEAYKIRFKDIHKGILHLQNVPNYQFILIHCGNTSKDTEGCIIVGSKKINDDYIKGSEAAYRRIYPIIADALIKGEKVFINIID
jgi:hypothetical protein